MFESTLDLITKTASSSLYVFCFCNLIIVIILVGSKPTSNLDQQSEIPLRVVNSPHTIHNINQGMKAKVPVFDYDEVNQSPMIRDVSISNEDKVLASDIEDKSNYNDYDEDDVDKDNRENDDDNELRIRVEEFIERVNKGWRAELLRSSQENVIL